MQDMQIIETSTTQTMVFNPQTLSTQNSPQTSKTSVLGKRTLGEREPTSFEDSPLKKLKPNETDNGISKEFESIEQAIINNWHTRQQASPSNQSIRGQSGSLQESVSPVRTSRRLVQKQQANNRVATTKENKTIKSLNGEIEIYTKELESVQIKIKYFEVENKKLEETKSSLEIELDQEKTTRRAREVELQDTINKLYKKQQKLLDLKQPNIDLNQPYHNSHEYEKLKQEHEVLKGQCQELYQSYSQVHETMRGKKSAIENLTNALEALSQEAKKSHKNIEELEDKRKNLMIATYDSLSAEHQAYQAQQDEMLKENLGKFEQEKVVREQKEAELISVNAQLDVERQKYINLEQKGLDLKAKYQVLKSNYEKLQETKNLQKSRIKTLKNNSVKRLNQLKAIKAENKELTAQSKSLSGKIIKLEKGHATYRTQRIELIQSKRAEVQEKEEELKALKVELATEKQNRINAEQNERCMKAVFDPIKNNFHEELRKNRENTQEIAKLSQENKELQQKLQEVNATLRQLFDNTLRPKV